MQSKLEVKNEQIEILKDDFTKIENSVFGNTEERSTEDIIEGVDRMTKILFNISKYLNLDMEKIINLFKGSVPNQEEVQEEPILPMTSDLESDTEEPNLSTFKPK